MRLLVGVALRRKHQSPPFLESLHKHMLTFTSLAMSTQRSVDSLLRRGGNDKKKPCFYGREYKSNGLLQTRQSLTCEQHIKMEIRLQSFYKLS